jgi:hypothetical protein
MAKHQRDEAREARILTEIVVDAYDPQERALSWYVYLEEALTFPFLAKCQRRRAGSPQGAPLQVGDEVEIIGMAPEVAPRGFPEHELFVMMRWEREGLGVPLSQLAVVHADEQTQQAVADWHYWVEQGYQF